MLVRRAGEALLLLLPGALAVYLSFNAGGFFVDETGLAAVAVALVLVLRTTLADEPFAGLGGFGAVATSALALFTVWTLASAAWSDSASRALLEFDRALLYVLVFLLFASIARSPERLRWIVRGVALGFAVVCLIGLVTRVAPDVWPISPNTTDDRLSYPVTYWNTLGLMAAMATILCFHITSSTREPAPVRVFAAALVPLLSATLILTFSRGATAVGGAALLVYMVLSRPRGLLGGLIATLPAVAVAVVAAYDADLVASTDYTSDAAINQGHDLAATLLLCAAGAALLRALLLRLDTRLFRFHIGRRSGLAALAAGAALLLVALVAVDAPGEVRTQYDRFVEGEVVQGENNTRERLLDPGNNGRLDHWDVALEGYRDSPLHGEGAGTYQLLWAQHRDTNFTVVDGHSLYVEVLGELGIVGLALILFAVLAILAGLAARLRDPQRSVYAAVFAVALAWAVHAGIDWDWEMPAVTLPVLALSGAALGMPAERARAIALGGQGRVVVGLAVLVVAVTPALAWYSQKRLNRAVEALKANDCREAIDAGLDSIGALGLRPEPWEIVGYCDSRLGAPALARRALENAVDRDPDNWEFYYGLALVRGAWGRDPRPATREALRLNPRDKFAQNAAKAFLETDHRSEWIERARAAPLRLP